MTEDNARYVLFIHFFPLITGSVVSLFIVLHLESRRQFNRPLNHLILFDSPDFIDSEESAVNTSFEGVSVG